VIAAIRDWLRRDAAIQEHEGIAKKVWRHSIEPYLLGRVKIYQKYFRAGTLEALGIHHVM
jgi:hypothetical protein